ncbi:Glycine hydroxymethyltransferase [Zostera marina]|uniref:Glycine hydroxymethyltransferase n=1 Tax=Zostera marina TaxID=29655 RepID=A0A0K9NI78_ZOSMR|nr:Glycine hydroxymethyltransferase [Zostera marina]
MKKTTSICNVVACVVSDLSGSLNVGIFGEQDDVECSGTVGRRTVEIVLQVEEALLSDDNSSTVVVVMVEKQNEAKKNHCGESSTSSTVDSGLTKDSVNIRNGIDNNVVSTHLTPFTTMNFVKSWRNNSLELVDPKVPNLIKHEKHRQSHGIKLIASENFSPLDNLRRGVIGTDSPMFIVDLYSPS